MKLDGERFLQALNGRFLRFTSKIVEHSRHLLRESCKKEPKSDRVTVWKQSLSLLECSKNRTRHMLCHLVSPFAPF